MTYFVYFTKAPYTFRNEAGDLHRDFRRDPSSAGSLIRKTKRQAVRLGLKLASRYGVDVTVEQCWYGRRLGKTARWVSKSWTCWPDSCSGPGQAPETVAGHGPTEASAPETETDPEKLGEPC